MLEDSTKTKFNYDGESKTYAQLLSQDNDFEIMIRADIKYEDIYVENEFYYQKNLLTYELFAYKDSFKDVISIPLLANNLPVTTIGKYALSLNVFNKLSLSDSVIKIKSYALCASKGKVFIPNTVTIINANGLYLENGSVIYTEAASKKEDWDSNWNSRFLTVNYSTSRADFNNL